MVEEAISFWTEIQRYEDLLAADPRSLSFAPLSELYRKLGLLDDAISVARKGCDLHPDYPGGLFALGAACFDKGLRDQARQALERVVLLSPENLRAQKLLGQLYVEAGETALARQALEQVLSQNPDDTESALLLRSISSAAGGAKVAEAASRAGELPPEEEFLEDAEIIEELTELFEEVPEPETDRLAPAAAGALASAEGAEAAEVPAWFDGSELPEALEIPDACDLFAVAEAPGAPPPTGVVPAAPSKDPLTTATLAELYVSQGFLDKAIAIYQELLGADPENDSYRLRCGELSSARERLSEAGPAPVSPPETDLLQQTVAAPGGELSAELSRWLDNIRRRRDGV